MARSSLYRYPAVHLAAGRDWGRCMAPGCANGAHYVQVVGAGDDAHEERRCRDHFWRSEQVVPRE